MVILDITAVNVALPQLATGLHINSSDIAWTVTSYSLMFGSLLLLGGRAADLIGRRRMFLTGLGIFTAASVASALAASAMALFAARAGQGVGAAMLSPAALSIIMATFTEGHERARARVLGAQSGVREPRSACSSEVRHVAHRLASDLPDQRPSRPRPRRRDDEDRPRRRRPAAMARPRPSWHSPGHREPRSDRLRALQATSAGWASLQTLGIGAAGIFGLVAFTMVEMRTTQPLVQIQRLADRGVGGGFVTMLAASAVLFGTFLLSSLYMQDVVGAGAMETGLAFLPLAIAIAAGVHAGSHAVTHAGVRTPMAFDFAVTAAGMLLLSGVEVGGSYLADVMPGMIVAGFGLGQILVCARRRS